MARKARDTRLETRTARAKLAVSRHPYQRLLERGVYLLYYRGARRGSWSARVFIDGRYAERKLALADDFADADGETVLDFSQAQQRALNVRQRLVADPAAIDAWPAKCPQPAAAVPERSAGYAVKDAVADYLAWYSVHRKALANTRTTCNAHILPALGDRQVAALTTQELRQWHEGLATAPARLRSPKNSDTRHTKQATEPRARRATANRVLTVLKAALNHAYHEGKVDDDQAWRRVRPFKRVDAPKVRYLTEAQCRRLVNACEPDFRELVRGALYTGCRYGELTALTVGDFDRDASTLTIRDSKSGRPRHVPLSADGAAFLERMVRGRPPSARLFQRGDGSPWGPAFQKRPIAAASKAGSIEPAVSFHVLRHTYASQLAMRGVPLQVIATALGHADTRMVEKHYAHLAPSYVASVIRQHLPNLGSVSFVDNVVGLPAGRGR